MRRSSGWIRAAVVALGVGALVGAVGAAAGADPETFDYTGDAQEYAVPGDVCEVTVDAYGAEGGSAPGFAPDSTEPGGAGGRLEARLNVTPGERLGVYVGQQGGPGSGVGGDTGGAGGFNGGGGGAGGQNEDGFSPGEDGAPGQGGAGGDDTSTNALSGAGGGGGGGDQGGGGGSDSAATDFSGGGGGGGGSNGAAPRPPCSPTRRACAPATAR